jgi:serine/threonine protein kinase/tetratricopeptide (TPR) repeat protein
VGQLPRKRVEELLAAARSLTGEGRIAFLKKNCGKDEDLFEQVISLLHIDGKSGPLDSALTVSMLPIQRVIADRFRVIRYIAEGGMGTVYEAEDLTLGDHVALKTIRPNIASDPKVIERFKREIWLAKRVTHPNVCRIHDLGVDHLEDGTEFLFLTMQFLNGETLASLVKRGPISTNEALPLIEDMADALSAAHQAGVIHRDFKSSNVMLVNSGRRISAIVTDFGLARSVDTNSPQTHAGIVGTVDYMAPEQIKDEDVTAATDIYSLGIVMYEMVTGRRPFTGDSTVTVALKHLNDDPKPPRDLAPNLDPNWNETILVCLKKLPQQRLQSAAEVKGLLVQNRVKLGWQFPRSRSKRAKSAKFTTLSIGFALMLLLLGAIPSIRQMVEEWLHIVYVPHGGQLAVLPLTMPGADPQGVALEYGLAETLATRLTQVTGNRALQVVPASEIRAKGITSLDQARQEFGVTLGLELSLRRSGEMVRVNYGLIDARTHHELRGDTITAPASDGFAIEDKVAESVVKTLELDLQPQERQLLVAHGTSEPAAYDYYLEGRGYLQEFQKPENVESAITLFDHTLEKDPKYALAYSGLGEAYWRKYEVTHEKHWAEQARRSCEASLSLDSTLASAHSCLGFVFEGTGMYEESAKQYQLATAREPTNDGAIRGLATAYQRLGRTNEAERTYLAAIGFRPNYWENYNALGIFYFTQGHYSQAAEMFTRVTELAPDSFRGYSNLGAAYLQVERYDDAIKALKRSLEIRPTHDAFSNLATADFRLRKYNDAAYNYSQALARDDKDYLVWGNLGDAYYYSEDNRPRAAGAYEKAIYIATRNLEVNPRDASIHGDIAGYYSMLGKREDALQYLKDALSLSAETDPALLYQAALVYNQLGDTTIALRFLTKAIAAGYSVSNISSAQALGNLHSNPEFQAILGQHKSVRKSP